MNNFALKTKITTHKPPRIYASFIGETIPMVYDSAATALANHLQSARKFVANHLPSEAIGAIHSARLSDDEMVHVITIAEGYINPTAEPRQLELITNPESTGINDDHSVTKETL